MTELELILNALETVLCDPEGNCCISGSEVDRETIDRALTDLRDYIAYMPPQEPGRGYNYGRG